jgi:hypothetical protein
MGNRLLLVDLYALDRNMHQVFKRNTLAPVLMQYSMRQISSGMAFAFRKV